MMRDETEVPDGAVSRDAAGVGLGLAVGETVCFEHVKFQGP